MMKVIKKVIIYMVSVGVLVSILTGCSIKSWDDMTKIEIDGVRYEMIDGIRRELDGDAKMVEIGVTGGMFSKTGVYVIEGDVDRNFILLHEGLSSMWRTPLVRTDKEIPEPSADTITKLKCIGAFRTAEGEIESFEYILDEADIIQELFTLFNDNKIKDSDDFTYYRTMIYCYSDELPGMYYPLQVRYKDGKFICGNFSYNYFVDMPYELLEKISGQKNEALILEDV